jgi:site-specific DNA-methyltransferase (adenine-specific)
MTKLSDLQPDAANANRGTAKGQKAIVGSIQRSKLGRSIVVDRNNKIIGGNKTTEAVAEVLGVDAELIVVESAGDKLLVHKRTDLDLDDPDPNNPARQLAFSDNLTSHFSFDLDPEVTLESINAGFSFDALGVTLPDLSSLGVDVGRNGKEPGPPPIDKAAELREKWGVELGQLWQLGEHRLICGDCTDRAVVEKVMGGEGIDLLLADPPYGKLKIFNAVGAVGNAGDNLAKVKNYGAYENEQEFVLSDMLQVVTYDKAIIWGGNNFTDILPVTQSWLIWDKRAGERTLFYADCEMAWSNLGITAKVFNYTWQGMIRAGERTERDHPTQKPVALYEWCLELAAGENVIYDPTLGSGSNLLACENLSRHCRAVEIDPGYVAVTLQRWADHTTRTPELIETL